MHKSNSVKALQVKRRSMLPKIVNLPEKQNEDLDSNVQYFTHSSKRPKTRNIGKQNKTLESFGSPEKFVAQYSLKHFERIVAKEKEEHKKMAKKSKSPKNQRKAVIDAI